MSDDWEKDMEEHQQQQSRSTSDFYSFGIGAHYMRIMTAPVKKASRFGHGICYPGATYCDPAIIEKEYEQKMEEYGENIEAARKNRATMESLKRIKKPTRPNIEVKWTVWAYVRKTIDEKERAEGVNELRIVDLPNSISAKLLELKRDTDMGSGFDGFPMPYDVKITKSKKKVKGTWTPKDVEYDLLAGTKREPIAEHIVIELEKKITIADLFERMYAKQQERTESGGDGGEESGGHDYPQEEINPDDILF